MRNGTMRSDNRWTTAARVLATAAAMAALGASPTFAGKPGGGGGGGTPGPEEITVSVARRDGGFDLAVTDAGGASVRTIVAAAGDGTMRTSWSPDRTRIAFSGTVSGPGVYVVGADGTGLTLVAATTEAPSRVAWSPAAAPGGNSWILFDDEGGGGGTYGNRDLFLVAPTGGPRVRLTSTTGRSEIQASWNRSADTLAIVHLTYPGGATELRAATLGVVGGLPAIVAEASVTDVSGSPLRGAYVHSLDWARTSDTLAVSATVAGATDPDLWVVPVAAPTLADNITGTSGEQERGPTWSSDDSRIAFWIPGGKTSVKSVPSDGSATATTLRSGARWPDWRR